MPHLGKNPQIISLVIHACKLLVYANALPLKVSDLAAKKVTTKSHLNRSPLLAYSLF